MFVGRLMSVLWSLSQLYLGFSYALSLSIYVITLYLGLGFARTRDATRVTRPAIESDAFLSNAYNRYAS
jgi:hypothetical protein